MVAEPPPTVDALTPVALAPVVCAVLAPPVVGCEAPAVAPLDPLFGTLALGRDCSEAVPPFDDPTPPVDSGADVSPPASVDFAISIRGEQAMTSSVPRAAKPRLEVLR